MSGRGRPRHFQCQKCPFDGLKNETNNSPFHCPMPPVLRTERIAHLSTTGDCCAARFDTGLCRLGQTATTRRSPLCRLALAADIGPDLAGYRDGSECATVEQSCLGSRSSNTAIGYELWCLCNDHSLFQQSHNARPIFCCCHAATTCKGAV